MGVFTHGKVAIATPSFWFAFFACLSLCFSLLPPTCTLPLEFLCPWTSLFILQCLYVVGWRPAEQCREDRHRSAFLGNLFLQQSNIQRCFGQSSESCGWVEPSFILQSSPVGCYSRSAGKIRPVILEISQSSRKKILNFLWKLRKISRAMWRCYRRGFV